MPLAVSQDNSVATVKPRGKSPYTTRAGGICSKIGAPYVSQRVFFFFIIVFRDMNTRTLKHTHRKRRRGEENLKPKRLRVQESPRFAHQTGFTDESPLSVTVTHRHTHTHKHSHTYVCIHTHRRQSLGPAWTGCWSHQRAPCPWFRCGTLSEVTLNEISSPSQVNVTGVSFFPPFF